MSSLIEKIFMRIRQYGLLISFKRYVLLKLIKPVYNKKRQDIVLIIPNHRPKGEVSDVKKFTSQNLSMFFEKGCINNEEYDIFSKFIENNSDGYYIEVDEKLAAWAFVQKAGVYKYGSYLYNIPQEFSVLKNLYVKPFYRGKSLGKILNKTRIDDISTDKIPLVFVLPENRYAIRNLKMFGFTEAVKITHVKWIGLREKVKVEILNDLKYNTQLIRGFKLG